MTAQVRHLIIHQKSRALLREIFEDCGKFPKSQRFVLSARLEESVLDFLDAIVYVNNTDGSLRKQSFLRADIALERVRIFVETARDLRFLSVSRTKYLLDCIDELGRMLGGWKRSLL